MSHIATIKTTIQSIPALRAAVAELGGELLAKSTFVCYQTIRGTAEPCDFAIKMPGINYEVGVSKQSDGTYKLAWDTYTRATGSGHDGGKLLDVFGQDMQKLTQLYACHQATALAQEQGFTIQRVLTANGDIELTAERFASAEASY